MLVSIVLLGTTGFFLARPTRNAIKGWQARRHAAKAFALLDQEKWQEAKDEAVAAYQLRNNEPDALRAVARFLSRTRQPQALEFWDQLAKTAKLNRDDLRDEGTVALLLGDAKRAAPAIAELGAAPDAIPRDWLLNAQLQLQQGAPDKALESIAKMFAHQGATAREELQASLLQLQAAHTGNAEVDQRSQSEAWQRLNELAQRDDAVALDSLVILAQRHLAFPASVEAGVSPAEQKPDVTGQTSDSSDFRLPTSDVLIARLESHPLSKAPQKLLATDLQTQENPAEKDALIQRAVDEFRESDNSSLIALARWLNGKAEFQRQLDTIPLERAAQDRELFLQHLDALGALGRWDEIERLLESERFPLDPVIQHMYLARANTQQGQPEAAKNEWLRAVDATNGDAGKLMTVGEYAEKNGATEIAESAYQQVTSTAPKLRAAWQGRLRLAQAAKDTRRMHDILGRMLEQWPNDTAVQNDEAYTRLLLLGSVEAGVSPADPNRVGSAADSRTVAGETPASTSEELIRIEQLARELVERQPTSLPHRTLLALDLLKQQRPAAALQVYDGIQIATNTVTPSALAVHASVLAANGNGDAARGEISHVPTDSLLPEEKAGTEDLRD